jgi:histidine triad (HIT) family protein
MDDCIFCKIAARQAKSSIVYEDDEIVAFEDIRPQAPVHLLIIPRRHMVSLNDAHAEDAAVLGRMHLVAAQLAKERGLATRGYRTLINNGAGAGQSVFHIHIHVLGGRVFHWPPG